MLIAQMSRVKKYYNDRLVLEVDDFKIYDNDRIGVVGVNGSGKTTFLNILTDLIKPDEGVSNIFGPYSYIKQIGNEKREDIDNFAASRLGVSNLGNEGLSGGEITRLKIAKTLSKENVLIIGDEPTSNLDREGIELLQKQLEEFKGALLIVSHDREFLDEVCSSILEIENGKIHLYNGNYSKYKKLKEEERERAYFEYEKFIDIKSKLNKAVEQKKNEVRTMRKVPKRMGNSEARLHKMGNQDAKATLDRRVNAIKTRIDKLEVKEKPKELPKISVDFKRIGRLYCKIVFSAEALDKYYGDRVIFRSAQFKIFNNSKTAVIGSNGCGKTTLIKMIVNSEKAVNCASGIKIGYFSQDTSILENNKSLLRNVMKDSVQNETFVRILLARLQFKEDDLKKNASLLSGGERVKAALVKIIVSDFNVLVLDEPTNYLDIYSMEAVEEALLQYQGTIIFVSHDRRFVSNIANHIISIENHKTICFDGSFEEYCSKKERPKQQSGKEADKMILQYRLTEVLSKLSMPSKHDNVEALEDEYNRILTELKNK